VRGGYLHTCGIRLDHTLWCWGSNHYGQLGLGDYENRNVPTRVGNDANWVGVRSGDGHSCGVRLDHTLWCWGFGYYGQLGLGDTSGRSVPTQVGGGADWTRRLGAGGTGEHTCSIRLNHTLWCWGWNNWGILGLGDTDNRLVPNKV
jgi:alpha-tubulin suppressor-like RCC1 family protein